MPSYLDLALIGVVLVSALLSMLRGFTREVLAIASWAAAAAAAYYFHPMALPYIKPYISKDTIALAVAASAVFFGTLLVVSIITVKISDLILDSKIGALDRSLGFLFGAGRGYLLCVIGFIFFAWLVPEKNYPVWVQTSKTRAWLEATGSQLQAMLPENLDQSISKILKKQKGDEPPEGEGEKSTPAAPTQARPGQRTEIAPPPPVPTPVVPATPSRQSTPAPAQAAQPAQRPANAAPQAQPSQRTATPSQQPQQQQPPRPQGPQTIDALLQQQNQGLRR